MTDNLPILYQNILFALPSDHARKVFLWAVAAKMDPDEIIPF